MSDTNPTQIHARGEGKVVLQVGFSGSQVR